jgi:uncharacterized protein (DUF302 family)
MTPEGSITIRSNYGPKDTVNRLETQIKAKGLNVFAHIDQAAGAAAARFRLARTGRLGRAGPAADAAPLEIS